MVIQHSDTTLKASANKAPTDVACFIRSMWGGGAEKANLNLLREFVDFGLKVDLLLARCEGDLINRIPPEVNLIDLECMQVWKSLPKLVSYLKKERPKALIASLHYPAEIAVWARQIARVPTKIVVVEHNTLSVEAKNSNQLSVRFSPIAAKLSYPLADKVVAVSKGVANDLSKITSIPIDKIDVIYNPVIGRSFFQKSQEEIDHPWFNPGQPPVILALGRLHPQKNFANLIHAFSQVRKLLPVRLMILGIGPQEDELRALIHELDLDNDVLMPGFFQNPYPYIAKSAVFAMSSDWEGLPLALIEALALNVPIVSTDCPSGPFEILDSGKYGSLVPVANSDAMAEGLSKALTEPKSVDSSGWIDQFTSEFCAKRFLEVLEII